MNNKLLQQKINSLSTFATLNSNDVAKFGNILGNLSGWDLFRINPIKFADDYGFDRSSILDIFIHGAKIGLFDFEWNMLCPLCGGIIYNYNTIAEIKGDSFHCSRCDIDVKTDLSDFIEVAFSINPSVEKLELNPFGSFDNYLKYFISQNHQMPKGFTEYYKTRGFKDFKVIYPGESAKISFKSNPNELYRLVSADNNSLLRLQFNDSISDIPQIIEVDVLQSCFSPDTINLSAGEITLSIKNNLNRTTGVNLNLADIACVMGIIKVDPPKQRPFLTGKKLLTTQSFRDLFKTQTLPNDLKLRVSNVTILFTDLKGSTELYDKTGDMFAYNLVQEHFEILKDSTRRFSGAIVKTIGDAIMSSFSTPQDGLLSAIDMLNKIRDMNNRDDMKEHEIAIKIGLNEGTALVVTANETLDYFGQTVNISARVQGLASAGEIWITDPIYKIDNFNNIVQKHKLNVEKKSAYLKGVSQPTNVYRCSIV